MLFSSVDLREELEKERNLRFPDGLLDEVSALLENDVQEERAIHARLTQAGPQKKQVIDGSHLDPNKVFDEEGISRICTHYRLRFLGSDLFRGEIPYEAITATKEFEKQIGQKVQSYKIVAPAERFILKDSMKDPLLLADLGNGYFYLICQWGTDMSWYRKWLNFPFRNITTLAFTAALIGLILTCLLPLESMVPPAHNNLNLIMLRGFTFSVSTGFFFTVALIFGIKTSKDFSENVWNSAYFN